jgi:GT2 family glycosyltransferase
MTAATSSRGEDMRVAAVIVTYRSADEIIGCLESVERAGREVALETVVVDNASDDETVGRIRNRFPDCRLVLAERNRGFAAGCNRGIESTTAELVLLLNPDARLRPGTLATMVRYLDENQHVGIVGPALEAEPGVLQRDISATGLFPSFRQSLFEYTRLGRWYPDSPWVREYFLADFDRRSNRPVAMVQGACMLVRRSLLDAIGAFDERFFLYFEETDLCKRAVDAGREVHYLGEVAAVHAGARSRSDHRPDAMEFIRSLYRFHHKHYGPVEATALWLVMAPYHVAKTARMSVAALLDRGNERLRADLRTVAERCGAHFRLLLGPGGR